MKGVLICGGVGSRLYPLTKTVNKQLMPVYNEPLVHFPLKTLIQMGVDEVMIVSGIEHADQFIKHFNDLKEFENVRFQYAVQKTPGGIAQAVGLARHFAGDDDIVVILGDNIYEDDFSWALVKYREQGGGAKIFVKEVPDPKRFGVPEFGADGCVSNIIEKPENPPTNYCVTGLYIYDKQLWDFIDQLAPSGRGELEITDVNNLYIKKSKMTHHEVKGEWIDAGTFDSLLRATLFVARKKGVAVDGITQPL